MLFILGTELYSIRLNWELPDKTGWTRLANLREDAIPGDLGFDPLDFTPKKSKNFEIIRTKELNNGRLAIIATAGMIAQELVTGTTIGETWNKFFG